MSGKERAVGFSVAGLARMIPERPRRKLHELLRSFGIDVVQYVPHNFYRLRRARCLLRSGASSLLDVGAHEGEYATEIQADGYRGQIYSFEPAPEAYSVLANKAHAYEHWKCYQLAFGDTNERRSLNIAESSAASSLLLARRTLLDFSPQARQVRSVEVEVTTIWDWSRREGVKLSDSWLKIDVQGYEMTVLRGCGPAISAFRGIEVECALEPLYEGEIEFPQLLDFLRKNGYRFTSFGIGGVNPDTGAVLYMDAIFERGSCLEGV